MSNVEAQFDLEAQVRLWGDRLRARGNFQEADLRELESHLRDEIEDLIGAGLAPDEAFLISVKRMGSTDTISHEFAKVNTENLWRQLFVERIDPEAEGRTRRDIGLIILFALLAGTLAKIPQIFGLHYTEPVMFYVRNASLCVMPLVAGYFLIKRYPGWKTALGVLGVFAVSAVLVNVYPFFEPGDTVLLTGIHLPIFLWLVTGLAYAGSAWRNSGRRMDFIRFTGETFIYTVLIGCGVAVLTGFTEMIFDAIQIDVTPFVVNYLLVYGLCAAPIITVYLVEAKKSIVENFAPVLAKIFSPLFLLVMAAFLVTLVVRGNSPFVDRNYLMWFDFMLALVLGLVLYVISSRNIRQTHGFFDYLVLALILAALIIDGNALWAILVRLSSYGFTPNRLAVLGENLVLLVNLAGLAVCYVRYFLKKIEFAALEKWQTNYLAVYLVWAAIVAFGFPIVFGFK